VLSTWPLDTESIGNEVGAAETTTGDKWCCCSGVDDRFEVELHDRGGWEDAGLRKAVAVHTTRQWAGGGLPGLEAAATTRRVRCVDVVLSKVDLGRVTGVLAGQPEWDRGGIDEAAAGRSNGVRGRSRTMVHGFPAFSRAALSRGGDRRLVERG